MQDSSYAVLAGIPVAVLGLAAWIAVLVLTIWNSELARTLTAALAVVALAFAVYLVILQLFVIDAICVWCMVNDLVLAPLLAVLALLRLRSPGDGDGRSQEDGSRGTVGFPLQDPRAARQQTEREGRRDTLFHRAFPHVIGTWRRMLAWMRSRISIRLSPVAVMPWLRRPITAWAGSGSRSISSATDSASSCVPHG